MKKFLSRFLTIVITGVLCISAVSFAWVIQDATIGGISISTNSASGPTLYISPDGNEYSQTMEVSLSSTLKPSVFELGHFYNEAGEDVSSDESYYIKVQMYMYASENCSLKMTWENTGDLPIKVAYKNSIVSNGGTLRTLSQSPTVVTIYIYVDGDEFTEDGTASLNISFGGV